MRLRSLASSAVFVAVFAGCHTDPRNESKPHEPTSSHAPALEADASARKGGSASPPEERDAAEPSGRDESKPNRRAHASDASIHDASEPDANTPADASAPVDASAHADSAAPIRDAGLDAATADSGPPDSGPVIAPRTDGCPEDAPLPLNRVRVRAAAGQSAFTLGAKIQGSNAGPTTDFVDLATLSQAAADGTFAELTFANTRAYRYLRYYAPPGSQASIAELEFYSGARRLEGTGFGTASPNAGETFGLAFDGDMATTFAPSANGGGYAGIDIARGYVAAAVSFSPDGTSSTLPLRVELQSTTPGAAIHYTTDGTEPSPAAGTTYVAPIAVGTGRTEVRAIASAPCSFDSAVTSARYTIGQTTPVAGGRKSYHIGNSLTDTINRWLEPIADSTGVDHVYARWTIPGAPIKWLAEHQGEGFQDPEGANRFDTFVQSFAPIDHLSIQPYSDPDFASQGGAAVGLLTTALRYSPNVQFWVYAQWPGRTEWMRDAFANGGGTLYPDWQVEKKPTNWEEATRNYALYYEAFRDYVDPQVGGKPFLIVPGGLALVELKRQMDAGMIPGLTGDFFTTMFEDEVHLNPQAQYLVSLVFYACLYRQSPEGRVTSSGTGLTEAQALSFQRIAWDVASGYAGSGISR